MKRKKFKKLAGYIISFAMVFSVFSIPAAGYADENASDADNAAKTENSEMVQAKSVQSNTSGYVFKWLSGYDEDTGDPIYEDIPEEGIVIEDLFWERYTSGWTDPRDIFVLQDNNGDTAPIEAINGLACESSNPAVAVCEFVDGDPELHVTYKSAGESEITVKDSNDNVVMSFDISIQNKDPEFSIIHWDEYGENVPVSDKTINLAEYVELQGSVEDIVLDMEAGDVAHPEMYFDKVEWSCDSNLISIEVEEDSSIYCRVHYTGTEEEIYNLEGAKLTAVLYGGGTYDEEGGNPVYTEVGKAECVLHVANGIIKCGYSIDSDEYEYDWWRLDNGELYTDTDENVFLGVFDYKYNKLDVQWESSDESVLCIGRKGRVYPFKEGTALLTCKQGDKILAEVNAYVYDPDIYKKAKYIIDKGSNTAAFYQAMDGWNHEIPEEITVNQTNYTVTRVLNKCFNEYYEYGNGFSISIPKTVTDIGCNAMNNDAIKAINVAEGNTKYSSVGGVLFSADKKTLISYPPGKHMSNYNIPENTEKVMPEAFGDVYLDTITINKDLNLYDTDENGDKVPSSAFLYMCDGPVINIPLGAEDSLIYVNDYCLKYSLMINKINLNAASTSTSSLKLTWTESNRNGVEGYRVYKYDPKMEEYECIADIEDPNISSYSVKGLSPGSGYLFKVVAYDKYYNDASYSAATLKTPTKPSKVTISKLKTGSKYITAYWGKKTGTGYEVQIATNSKFTKAKTYTITSYKTTSKKITKLKKGKTYYVRVRAYKTYGSTLKGDWSTAKKIKCK